MLNMFGCLFLAFVLSMVVFTLIDSRLFPGSSSFDFPTREAHERYLLKQQLLCREMHIVEAAIAALICGGIASFFMSASFVPIVASIVAVEAVWVLLTFVARPQKLQTYTIMPHLFTAAGAATVVGAALAFFVGATLWPLVIAGGAFWLAWVLLMPL